MLPQYKFPILPAWCKGVNRCYLQQMITNFFICLIQKLEEQTKELAGEVATLREALEKLITHSTWLRAQSENY